MSCPSEGRGSVSLPTTIRPSTLRLSSARSWYCSRMLSPRASHRKTFTRPAPKASSAPMRMGITNRPWRSLVSRPTVPVRPPSRPCARVFGTKDSCSAASTTRARVRAATSLRPLRAFDAVATETPASLATSVRVTTLALPRESLPAMRSPSSSAHATSAADVSSQTLDVRLNEHYVTRQRKRFRHFQKKASSSACRLLIPRDQGTSMHRVSRTGLVRSSRRPTNRKGFHNRNRSAAPTHGWAEE